MAMKEVAEATAPLRKMSHKNLEDYEADSLPYRETGMIKTYRSLQVYQWCEFKSHRGKNKNW